MTSNTFEGVRFNGCKGSIKVVHDELIFEDESALATLSWCLDSLTEEVLKPADASVDLTFDLGGIKERTTFQLKSFPEIARLRSAISQRKKALRKEDSVARIAWDEPSAALDPDSLSSMKSFYEEDASTSKDKCKEPSLLREQSIEVPKEPTVPLVTHTSSHHHSDPKIYDPTNDFLKCGVKGSKRESLRLEDSVATIKACNVEAENGLNESNISTTNIEATASSDSNSIAAPPPATKVHARLEPNELFVSSRNLNVSTSAHPINMSAKHHREQKEAQKLAAMMRASCRQEAIPPTATRASDEKQEVNSNATMAGAVSVSSRQLSPRGMHMNRRESKGLRDSARFSHRQSSTGSLISRSSTTSSISSRHSTANRVSDMVPLPEVDSPTQVGAVHSGTPADAIRFAVCMAAGDDTNISEKSEKSEALSMKDATEVTMLDMSMSGVGDDTYGTRRTNHLIEATLVEEGSQYLHSLRNEIVASPVDVIAEESSRRKMNLRIGIVCGFSLFVMVIALVLSFTLGVSDEPIIQVAEEPLALTPEARMSFLEEHVQAVLQDTTALEDPQSPQSRALRWMASEDRLTKNMLDEGIHDGLNQRFIVATFYYSTAEEGPWHHCEPAETGEKATCVHPVLEIYTHEGVAFDQLMAVPAFRWLSYVEECRWAGIECSDGVHISKINLAGYDLEGPLPAEVGSLSSLELLDLQQNKITGVLPPQWGSSNAPLTVIRLDRNRLSGNIPEEWCNISSGGMLELTLSNNELTGDLPDCLGNFQSLQTFSVLHNHLSGAIPSSLANLSSLHQLHLAGNSFVGFVPEELCSNQDLLELTADCAAPEASSFVFCSCCTTCCVAGEDEETCNASLVDTIASRNKGA